MYKQLTTVKLLMEKDSIPTSILEGKKVNPKDVIADRRKSPGPGEYRIVNESVQLKQKLVGVGAQKFDTKAERFKNSPFDAPSRSTAPEVGPGAYQYSDEVQ